MSAAAAFRGREAFRPHFHYDEPFADRRCFFEFQERAAELPRHFFIFEMTPFTPRHADAAAISPAD